MKKIKKVIILGSGALKIGEAGEFDYSGSQAIKALKEEGVKTVLVNPNIATIQTSEFLADKVYFLPVNTHFVEEVIKKEKPEGILLSFGGQTALNCGIDLHKEGILKKYGVEVLGTPISAIILSEDRSKFAKHLKKIGEPIPASMTVKSVKEIKNIGKTIGFPVMVRAAYTLGGQKSGVAYDDKELNKIVSEALVFAPQVLIEKYLYHYKELEYEIVRDKDDNCVAVCNMENFDPMGVHTGESIVVAPSQTLTNAEHQMLRQSAINIVRSLGIVGECNVQFALNPKNQEYYVIELNARLSRSSALASKATGYPLAYVAAKLILGKNITQIQNQVTKITQSCFEPALDYIVVKIPRWDLNKFKGAIDKIDSSMKSVGEVMAIGRNFEETIQKATRMLESGASGVTGEKFAKLSEQELLERISDANTTRLFAITEAISRGIPIDMIYELSGVDKWFLFRLKNITETEKELRKNKKLNKDSLTRYKQTGLSDKRIGHLIDQNELFVRDLRKKYNIVPAILQIDTLAGEFPAQTNYLYTTYNASHYDVKPLGKEGVMVLGSGPYRIGSSVEFDWSCVNTALALNDHQKKSIIVNCNPETVSTDYDISQRLYFEELTFERIADIFDFEKSLGTVISVGGQTPNNLAESIDNYGIPILGTKAKDIDRAEDRNKFSGLLDELRVKQPEWDSFSDLKSALKFANKVGYPVLVRPSYVLSGNAMSVSYNDNDLRDLLNKCSDINKTHPVTISKFISDAKEIEFDGVAENGEIKVFAISEHIENAGVHSGDASIIYPAVTMYLHTEKQIIDVSVKMVKALNITGPFNVQFLAKENNIFVIELNIRASRTFPFISKATGINFIKTAVDSFFGVSKKSEIEYPNQVLVKVPQFSFSRLKGADPVLRVEMASTGEVACFGEDAEDAYLKAVFSTGVKIDKKAVLLSLGGATNKERFLESVWRLKNLGFKIYATKGTYLYLKENGFKPKLVYKVHEDKKPSVVDIIESKKISMVINLSEKRIDSVKNYKDYITDGYLIRRATVDNNIPLFTDLGSAKFFVRALEKYNSGNVTTKAWSEYVKMK
ncbi:MAG: carbamoyl-phosphate synthase (glutamine-hydrolyzing) large subunit [Candidatus Shapirobacteria bacterium]|nr:carbamoyl-phosphate synthase (glutamine-hydrolyzing) large subunit [Candidatus Shapirobacteria bacterium]